MEDLGPPRSPAGPEDQLRGVLRAGEVDERAGDVRTRHLRVPPSQLNKEPALAVEPLREGVREGVEGPDMDADQLSVDPCCHPRRAPQLVLTARSTGECDHHPL